MTPPKPPRDDEADATRDEPDEVARARALILKRRNRFIAAAIAGLGAANGACSGSEPSVCLDMAVPTSGEGGGAAARPAPTPCLSMPIAARGGSAGSGGAGSGGSAAGKGGLGGMPSVCLSAPIDQCENGAPPPCEPPIDQDAGTEAPGEG